MPAPEWNPAMMYDADDDWGDEPSLTGLEQWDEDVWVEGGIASLERYLARHAAFELWCDEQTQIGRAHV